MLFEDLTNIIIIITEVAFFAFWSPVKESNTVHLGYKRMETIVNNGGSQWPRA